MSNYHVDPGTSRTDRLAPDLQLVTSSVGPMDNNAYLVLPAQGPALLIDAAAQPELLLDTLRSRGAELGQIVTTHRHHDHIGALAAVMAGTGASTGAGQADAEAIARACGVEVASLTTGDLVSIGDHVLEVIELRGHTPGSIALLWTNPHGADHLFTGDSLFPGGVGKTGTPDDFTSLLNDVTSRLFDRLSDDTVVHPGHGDATTLGAERPQLGVWRARGW